MKNKKSLLVFLFLIPYIVFADDFLGVLQLPEIVRLAEKKVNESIVTIEGFGGLLDSSIRGEGKNKQAVAGFSKPGEGPTTGVVISKDGYIITSTFNFTNEPKIITVTLKNGRKLNAKMLGRDFTRKICVLKINPGDEILSVPEFLNSKDIKVGQWSIAVGVGFGGVNNSISIGLISGKKRIFGKALQTDANISPANYGGALIDVEGRVIGICTPLSPNQTNVIAGAEWYDSGIGFVIPIADIPNIIQQLKDKKDIHFGKMGFLQRIDPKNPKEVYVDTVVPLSPAETSGLKSGDLILEIEGVPIEGFRKLTQVLMGYEAGSKISFKIRREKTEMTLSLTLETEKELNEKIDPGSD